MRLAAMRRLVSILLLLTFLGFGTGVAAHLHDQQHNRADAKQHRNHPAPAHDESNCVIHAQLHSPLLAMTWVPLLVTLGLFIAFLSSLAPALSPQRADIRLDCRGPPSC